MSVSTILSQVDVMAQVEAHRPAVIEVGDRPLTLDWEDLAAEADRVSMVLLDLGVRRGEAVAFQLPNWAECASVILGVLQIGAVVAPVMPVFAEREVAMVLGRSRARVFIVPESFRKRRPAKEFADVARKAPADGLALQVEHLLIIGAIDPRGDLRSGSTATGGPSHSEAPHPVRSHDFDRLVANAEPDPIVLDSRRPSEADIAQLLFTSGTTGEPKGVQHSHRSLGLATDLEIAHLDLRRLDRIYVPSPLAHQTGFLYGLMLSWRLGAPAILQPVWDARVALEQAFGQAGARFVQAATPFLMDLVDAVEAGAPAPASLRIFVATGAAVPRELAERATRVLDTAVCGAFGTTETCLGTLSAPHDPPASAWGSDGRPLAGIGLRIVDEQGIEVERGREGHYELSSPTMFLGYLDRPDLTAEVFTADGWYKTGDLGILDSEGFLHITGRVKDVINRGGEKVPVVEIENLLFAHPLVKDVAIVAMPDERLGERACAFVVTADGASAPLGFGEMQAHLAEASVSKYYWPERLETIEVLPRNPVGKIQKNLLRERVAALLESERDAGARSSARESAPA